MRLKPALLVWLWRQTLPVNVVALSVAVGFTLLTSERLYWPVLGQGGWGAFIYLFVLVHSIALTLCFGQPRRRSFAFLYSRGFTRNTLWLYTMLASALAVLTVWLPVGLVIWLRLRSVIQDHTYAHPYYPGGAFVDDGFIWPLLLTYAWMLPVMHYAWIRGVQPVRGQRGGFWVAATFIFAVILAYSKEADLVAIDNALRVAVAMTAAVLLLWGWRLHRRLEVG